MMGDARRLHQAHLARRLGPEPYAGRPGVPRRCRQHTPGPPLVLPAPCEPLQGRRGRWLGDEGLPRGPCWAARVSDASTKHCHRRCYCPCGRSPVHMQSARVPWVPNVQPAKRPVDRGSQDYGLEKPTAVPLACARKARGPAPPVGSKDRQGRAQPLGMQTQRRRQPQGARQWRLRWQPAAHPALVTRPGSSQPLGMQTQRRLRPQGPKPWRSRGGRGRGGGSQLLIQRGRRDQVALGHWGCRRSANLQPQRPKPWCTRRGQPAAHPVR